jgi:hypothetical protein
VLVETEPPQEIRRQQPGVVTPDAIDLYPIIRAEIPQIDRVERQQGRFSVSDPFS